LYTFIAETKIFAPSASSVSEDPLVSVVLVHYNRPKFLLQALTSLELQEYNNFEIIVVDDGSTDESALTLLTRLEDSPLSLDIKHSVTVVKTDNQYLGAARNLGVRSAKGEYIFFLDDDNYAKANSLSTYVKVAKATGADDITAGHEIFQGDSLPNIANVTSIWVPLGPSISLGLFKNCFGDANFFVKKSVFLAGK
jgi:glycosyltransferase involved in cell wall biosynthesis